MAATKYYNVVDIKTGEKVIKNAKMSVVPEKLEMNSVYLRSACNKNDVVRKRYRLEETVPDPLKVEWDKVVEQFQKLRKGVSA